MLLVSYNIHYCLGSDGGYDVGRVADVVAGADIICLQEVVQGWKLNFHADQAAEIAARLNRYCYFHGAFDADSSEVGEDGRIVNRRRTFGNAVLSRWPIMTAIGHALPKTALAQGFDLQRGFVEATIAAPAGPLRVYNTHLSHVSAEKRLPQLGALLQTVSSATQRGPMWDNVAIETFVFSETAPAVPERAVVMGDFNFTHRHQEYPSVCVGLDDAWRLVGNAEDRESFPGEGRIDHCFVTRSLAPAVRRAWIDQSSPASDHWPLFVEIDIG